MQSGRDVYQAGHREGWRPEPRITVSEWADEHRRLGTRAGKAPKRWRTGTTPYLREIMDALSPHSPYHRIVFMSGTQLGKTEAGLNWLGYIIHHAPAATLVMRPTQPEARRFSRQRLDPMIQTTDVIRSSVRKPRSREGGNSLLTKEFDGGVMFLVGSNSASEVKSMPIRNLFCDEIEEFPGDLEDQGDPIDLAEKRQVGPVFARRKVYLVSTPTIRDVSRIEREYLATDQRRYFIPCPECGHMDYLTWQGRDWLGSDKGSHHRIQWKEGQPGTAAMVCSVCGSIVEEWHKTEMLMRGEWRPTAEGEPGVAGFHLSALYSPLGWFPWAKAASEFLRAKHDGSKMKTWVNTVLGETFEDRSNEKVDPESLLARAERYPAEVPQGVGVLVASVDVQGDRLECAVKGYGAGEESWLIAFSQFHGDPGREEVWLDLDRFLRQEFTHESGQKVQVACVAVDSGGHHSEQVYRFCRARIERRVFAVRGGSERGKPVVGRPSDNNRYHAKLFTLCVDTAKEIIFSRFRIGGPGPGYCHLPEWIDAEYVAQLTAEKAIRKWVKNRGTVREWIKTRERNEALDLEVYCLAALYILGPALVRGLPERAAALARKPEAPPEPETGAGAGPVRRGGWLDGWRG